jgi:hypothetical protein
MKSFILWVIMSCNLTEVHPRVGGTYCRLQGRRVSPNKPHWISAWNRRQDVPAERWLTFARLDETFQGLPVIFHTNCTCFMYAVLFVWSWDASMRIPETCQKSKAAQLPKHLNFDFRLKPNVKGPENVQVEQKALHRRTCTL